MPISYAVGYALSQDFEQATMRELFRYADKNMYIDKNLPFYIDMKFHEQNFYL